MTATVERRGVRIGRRHVEFAGGPAAYLDRGEGGVPLLLVHGFGGDALTWQFNLMALAADRRVVAVDLPGHGESTMDAGTGEVAVLADWLARLIDALGLGRVDLVGHSLGARVALDLAARHRERARRLTLLACAGLGSAVEIDFLRAMRGVRTMEAAGAAVDRLFGVPSPYRDSFAKALLARMSDPASEAPLAAMLERTWEAVQARQGFDWSRLDAPAQLVWGTADGIVPPPAQGDLPPHLPVHLLPGVGHMPHVEAAGRVNALIKDFHS
ncbi:MAG TPA: alpha/beta fold hydrolase [Azospirillaceae bacterium]|nr:alpha/beta fold hydrolase [Azospirillaceae bacterium]